MGRVKFESTNPSSPGMGSGILVGRNFFLASAHCLNPDGATIVELGPNQKDRYKATPIDPNSQDAKEMGLKSGQSGDMILLRLPSKNGEAPGEKYGFTTIKKPDDTRPKILYHLGFSSGRGLSHSVTPFNPQLLTKAITKTPDKLIGKLVTWGEGKNMRKGIITNKSTNKDDNTTITMTGITKKGKETEYSYTIKEDKVYKTKDYNVGKEKPLKVPFFLQTPYTFGHDHVIISHKTTGGSSGGIYFDEEGNVFAVHHGKPTEERFKAAPTHHFENHQADFPWVENRDPIHKISDENKKTKNKQKKLVVKNAKNVRNAAIKSSNGEQTIKIPSVLYRFVSKEDAKNIRKHGIQHNGSDENEIPFLTKPHKGMAYSVGAVCVEKCVAVYPDLIKPPLTQDNISTLSQRNGVKVYKVNVSVNPEAIAII